MYFWLIRMLDYNPLSTLYRDTFIGLQSLMYLWVAGRKFREKYFLFKLNNRNVLLFSASLCDHRHLLPAYFLSASLNGIGLFPPILPLQVIFQYGCLLGFLFKSISPCPCVLLQRAFAHFPECCRKMLEKLFYSAMLHFKHVFHSLLSSSARPVVYSLRNGSGSCWLQK